MAKDGKGVRRGVTTASNGDTWAVVLAAGEGSRLRSLTKDASGCDVPKQFCSLRAGPSLLQEALGRAASVVPAERVCAVVAAQHDRWWRQALARLPAGNVVVQPRNRGTAHGMLLALAHVLERDRCARVLFFPADHHVADEAALAAAARRAEISVRDNQAKILLLGMAPDKLDAELGYIVPNGGSGPVTAVRRFVEKPSLHEACSLVAEGALWNAFIVAARASALLGLFLEHDARAVGRMRAAIRDGGAGPAANAALEHLYRELPVVDFSRDIAESCASELSVMRVPACGWSDLGTPERVARTLDLTSAGSADDAAGSGFGGVLSLEERLVALAGGQSSLDLARACV
jgi:mannose-1-phosphate guanylyltransferase